MALIASRLHLVWVATVCGKLKTDFRYSNTEDAFFGTKAKQL